MIISILSSYLTYFIAIFLFNSPLSFFFFNDPPTTEIYTLSLHDALPISATGYNPRKPGRKSHHPLMAFIADVEMVANFWLRSGDAHTANNFEAFLQQTLSNLQNKTIGLLRADTGFYSKKIFELLETRTTPIYYIIGCPMYVTIQRTIQSQKVWIKLDDGIEIAQTDY